MNLKQRLGRLEAATAPPAHYVTWWQAGDGSDAFTSAETGETLTRAELDTRRDAPGTVRIVVQYEDWQSWCRFRGRDPDGSATPTPAEAEAMARLEHAAPTWRAFVDATRCTSNTRATEREGEK